MRHDLGRLQSADKDTKPRGADAEWADLTALYEDQSRAQIAAHLQQMGMGDSTNAYPLDLGRLLRQVVDRSATVYRQPPSRYLTKSDKRLSEGGAEHKLMVELLRVAQYDVVWRKIDRLRTLLQQVGVRYYPDDARSSVVQRVFVPQNVMRMPNPAVGDLMEHDREFALRLGGKVIEHWYRLPVLEEGQRYRQSLDAFSVLQGGETWCMAWVDENGARLAPEAQPFKTSPVEILGSNGDVKTTHYANPYSELPVHMVYADHPGGAAWLPPSQSRQGWVRGLSALLNDIQTLVKLQAHNTRVYKRRNPNNKLAADTGPNVTLAIDAEEDLFDLKPSPAIEQCLSVVRLFARMFATSEYLPGNEFDPERQILTGAALRVQLQPLYDRREDQVPLVLPDEQSAWRRFRAVHNVHAEAWGKDALDEDTVMDVEVPDLEAPTTPTEAGNLAARQLAMGSASIIDLIQREHSCSRPEAIKRYERVKADLEEYPPLMKQDQSESTGPKNTDLPDATEPGPTPPDEQPDATLDGRPSVVSAIRSA